MPLTHDPVGVFVVSLLLYPVGCKIDRGRPTSSLMYLPATIGPTIKHKKTTRRTKYRIA